MRRYYLYCSRPIWQKAEYEEDGLHKYDVYKYSDFDYLGYIDSAKELVNYLGNPKYVKISDSLNPICGSFRAVILNSCRYDVYAIVDDKGRFRDYYEIARNIYHKTQKRNKYEFRNGPVPNLLKGVPKIGTFRYVKTFNELRNQLSDEEIKEIKEEYPYAKLKLRRAKRKNIPTTWDDIPRKRQRSWKKNSKSKRQYAIHKRV